MGLLEGLCDLETTTTSCILEFNKWKTKTSNNELIALGCFNEPEIHMGMKSRSLGSESTCLLYTKLRK